MKSVALKAFPRTLVRRGGVKKLRHSGRVPAVIYGRHIQAQNLEVDAKELEDLLHHSASENILVDLTIPEDQRPQRLALVQEVQHHPLNGRILHLDLHEVAPDEKVTVYVPVETTGEAIGVKTGGGVLEHVLFRVKVRALPKDIPEQLTVDVSHLGVNMAVHIGELVPPPGVEILGEKTAPVLAVKVPRAEVEETPAEAAPMDAGAVEMLKEKKEEGETAEAAPAKGAEKPPLKGAEKAGDKAADKAAEKKK